VNPKLIGLAGPLEGALDHPSLAARHGLIRSLGVRSSASAIWTPGMEPFSTAFP
jgi:hypothetical protein